MSVVCLYIGLGLAQRSCVGDGTWGPVDASDCESVAIREVRMQVRMLAAVFQPTICHLNAISSNMISEICEMSWRVCAFVQI